jgi:endonuclease-3 related protein
VPGRSPHVAEGEDAPLLGIYHMLLAAAGHRGWWPGRTRLEILLGAILTQNTSWTNVEKALRALHRRGLLGLARLRTTSEDELAETIRSSGYFRQKARKIRAFLALLDQEYGGSLTRMARVPTAALREQLLGVWGIGPETADSILLYAFGRPVFVVDAYTRRVLARHGLISWTAGYGTIQGLHARLLPEDAALFNDFHAQYVWVGHHFCGTHPKCGECPLRALLSRSGPIADPDQTGGTSRSEAPGRADSTRPRRRPRT